jgi:predicted nucleic acid-binding Zn ribbon protein
MNSKKQTRTMDVVLTFIAVFLLAFIVVMIVLYYITGAIPDTLCTCVFAVCGGECGVMGWIKTTKERQRDRKYEIEDRNHQESIERLTGGGSEDSMPE